MRTLLSEARLKYLAEKTNGYKNKILDDYRELFIPFGSVERNAWRRWIGKGDRYSDDLADVVVDKEKNMTFRARALLILLSPVWTSTRSIPWKWRSDINIHGETRTVIGAEDYRNSQGAFPLTPGDDTLIDLALTYLNYFWEEPLSLIEGVIINYNVFRRNILSILPVDHLLAQKAFDQYAWFDFNLSPSGNTWNHTPGYHHLSPLEGFLRDPDVPDIWKMKADEVVWERLRTRGDIREMTVWKNYRSILQNQLSRHREEGYSLKLLERQWRQVQTIDPSFGSYVDQAYSLLSVFAKDEETLHFGRELFQRAVFSKKEAFYWLDLKRNRSNAFGMGLDVVFFVRKVVENFGGEKDSYAARFIAWYKEWRVARERNKKKQENTESRRAARKQELSDGLNQ